MFAAGAGVTPQEARFRAASSSGSRIGQPTVSRSGRTCTNKSSLAALCRSYRPSRRPGRAPASCRSTFAAAVWAVSNEIASLKNWDDDDHQAVSVAIHGGADNDDPYEIVLTNHESAAADTLSGLDVAATYYCVVSRPAAGRVQLEVYSDAARTALVGRLGVTVDTARTWQYLYAANSYGDAPTDAAALSFDVENLNTLAPATEHSYYNESWQVLEERSDGVPAAQYLWDPRYVDAPVLRWRYSGQATETLYYTQDANWNITAVVSAAGSVVERYMYAAYGEVTVLDANWDPDTNNESDVANARLFQGEELNAETGLNASRFRDGYHPALGVWTSRDPAQTIDGSNLYQFCLSRPTSGTDPMGLCFGTAPNPSAWTEGEFQEWMEEEGSATGSSSPAVIREGIDRLDRAIQEMEREQAAASSQAAADALATDYGSGRESDSGFWGTLEGLIRGSMQIQAQIPLIGAGSQAALYFWDVGADIAADRDRGVGWPDAVADAYGRHTPFIDLGYLAGESWKSDTITSGVDFGKPITEEEFWKRNILFFGSEALALGGAASMSLRGAVGEAESLAPVSRVPGQLGAGAAHETSRLAELGVSKNTTIWRPTMADVDSAAFKVVVGDAKYTSTGQLRGTTLDATERGLLEIKGGKSVLDSSYQLRLQV